MFTGGPYKFNYRDNIEPDNEAKLGLTKSQARSVAAKLENTNWLNKGSGAAMLEVMTYTHGVDLFTLIVVVVELPTMGGVAVSGFVHTIRFHEHRRPHFLVLVLVVVLFALCIVLYSLYVVYKAWKFGFVSYFSSFWNVLDVFVVFFAWWMVSLDVAFCMLLEDTVETYRRYRKVRFQYLISVHFWRSCAFGMTAFCLMLRCFQFLELFSMFNRSLIVLAHVFHYIVSLLLYLLLLFFAVACFIYVIASESMGEFRALDASLLNVIFEVNSLTSDVLSHSESIRNTHAEWAVIVFAFLMLAIKIIAVSLSFAIFYATYVRFYPRHPNVEKIPFLLQQYFNSVFGKKEEEEKKKQN